MDIIADILTIATGGQLKTHIMYKANLSYTLLKKYLALLLETNLLQARKEDGRVIYTITKKGIEFLQGMKKEQQLQSITL